MIRSTFSRHGVAEIAPDRLWDVISAPGPNEANSLIVLPKCRAGIAQRNARAQYFPGSRSTFFMD